MIARASITFIRMTPRKLRLVADSIRKHDAEGALTQLKFTSRRAAQPLEKLLKQVIANARQLGMVNPLKIVRLEVGEGPVYKRFQAVSRGQAHPIVKYTSHVRIEVESKGAQPAPTVKTANSTAKSAMKDAKAKEEIQSESEAVEQQTIEDMKVPVKPVQKISAAKKVTRTNVTTRTKRPAAK